MGEVRATGIATLIDALGAGGMLARERAEDLVRQVTDLYGEALEHVLTIASQSDASQTDARQTDARQTDARIGRAEASALDAAPGTHAPGASSIVDALVSDELISGLLLVHGLHPQDAPTRVAAALESVRPYLGSHGGDVELLGLSDDGVVRLRLLGSCNGCPSSSVTLKLAVEDAIERAAPEVTRIDVEQPAKVAAVIPVEALRIRLADAPEPVPASADAGGSWEPVPELADLDPGEVAGFIVAGVPILATRTSAEVFVFRDYCPRCAASMAGATLQRALAAPAGGGLLRCPTCRKHFDVRGAGACIEDKGVHLDPLPLLLRAGVPSVAVPSSLMPSSQMPSLAGGVPS
ncbi:hypothetical protein D6T64_06955 [Cryobacterium melibiosiphilum]|uniref:Rieske domain-containing protein n=1 Tax=Cryobacterium melibiosiphilum TaxID=995039 RepID=A0A3A5MHY3_9MICO|nr:NifU family protein [Cryobacterium melibiosiphilum]RJT88665.1 hypothetical protein D6T64_09920 [Cryobacterium melibiosiphilum]RJT89427.1 hypothetical protein D6T64_06955 [Cryobacterium melibiosiphilum]